METEHYEFKTITFKNGKKLEITQEQANKIDLDTHDEESKELIISFYYKDGSLDKMIDVKEIAFIS